MSEVPCICGCNSVCICVGFCDQILVAFVHWHSNFVSSVGVQTRTNWPRKVRELILDSDPWSQGVKG